MRETHTYLGLELAGAKNQKTALAALEYYPKERKIFLLDIFDKIAVKRGQTGDEALLELLEELRDPASKMGVNVPLSLPPCIGCTLKSCTTGGCNQPAVKWMHEVTRKALRGPERDRVREFTPYTQRPIELWVRYQVMPKLPESHRFEIDETLGGNKGPLTARMHYLKKHLKKLELAEVWPKLSVAMLCMQLGLSKRIVSTYRQLEEGVHSREEILEKLAATHGIFIYERDVQKLSQSLTAFDAFICAYTMLLSDNHRCSKPPSGFPLATGWVEYPLSSAK